MDGGCSATELRLPLSAGVGLKAQHYDIVLDQRPKLGWFEVHPENYMGAGGPPHHYLTRIRERYPLSLHGVGLSIGGARALDIAHLDRLKALIDRYQPEQFSEHLAWSTHEVGYLSDLLPLPYTDETLATVCRHIDQAQQHLGRHLLLENPSVYVAFEASSHDEIGFLNEVVKRTGCGLLLDVNNVYVSSTNLARDPEAYIDAFPMQHVGEIHLAGHAEDSDAAGDRLLIDSHDRCVIDPVWELYRRAVVRGGPRPTLIEWDDDIPEWDDLYAEAQRAERIMQGVSACDAEGDGRDAETMA